LDAQLTLLKKREKKKEIEKRQRKQLKTLMHS